MKKILFSGILMLVFIGCDSEKHKAELESLNLKLKEKGDLISNLKNQVKKLKSENSQLKIEIENKKQSSDYYRFDESKSTEINVEQELINEKIKIIDQKELKDTLDISDNFFVYEHTSKIYQTAQSKFESFLENFDQVESQYGEDFFVRVLTLYNNESLPLETENSKTDIHILIQPTELGYENKTFVVSDFFNVEIKGIEKKGNSVELTFEHGKLPRKKETIIIRPELVKFKN